MGNWHWRATENRTNELANITREEKVQSVHQTVLTIIHREYATLHGKYLSHFTLFVFLLFLLLLSL